MSSAPLHTPRTQHEISPSKPGQTLQMLQGAYYAVAGLVTAVAVGVWEPPTVPGVDLSHAWVLRAVGLALALFGVYLSYAGYKGGRAPAGIGMWVALAVLVVETGAVSLGALPRTLLIDVAVESVFLVSWVTIMFRQLGKQADRAAGANPAVG